MDNSTPVSLLRRWLDSFLIWYAIFMLAYLVLRFIVQVDWNLVLLLHNGAPYLFLPVLLGFVLALLMKAPRFAGVYFLLSLIGLLWFAPALAPKFNTVSEDALPLRVISFNFYPYNAETDRALDWLLAQDADILLLQETHSDLAALESAYPHYAYSETYASLAIFSRYPILVNSEFFLGESPEQRAILDINGRHIALYNLHLWMPLNENEEDFILLRYDETRRNQQIHDLLAAVQGETLPLLMAGDFNMSEWSPIYGAIAENLQDAYRISSWGIGATFPAGDSEEMPDILPRLLRLDYLWYSEGFSAVSAVVGEKLGSDHLPLIVEMVIQ